MYCLCKEWAQSQPGAPATIDEVEELVAMQFEQGVRAAFKVPEYLDSELPAIKMELNVITEVVKAAISAVRAWHAAQINLLSTICTLRFKYYF